jgi:hypothetical protein
MTREVSHHHRRLLCVTPYQPSDGPVSVVLFLPHIDIYSNVQYSTFANGPEARMASAALSILFSLDQEQSPKSSSDSPLSTLAIMSTPIEDRLRTRAESQPDDNCLRLSRTSIIAPAPSSDAPNLDNSPQRSEASVIPPIQPNPQDQVQHALGASLEKEEEVETIHQVEDSEFCVNLL